VLYNLGNACYRQQKVGEAILFYERARLLAPTDPDIQHNLRFARAGIVDRIPEPEQGFVEMALRTFHTMLTLRTQLWLLTGLLFTLAVLIALAIFVSRNTRLWLSYVIALVLVLLGAIGTSAAFKIHDAERVSHAVVLTPSLEAYNAPKGDKVLFVTHEGTTVRIRQQMDEWYLVSLPNGVSGWVTAGSLGRI
jgi:hypothetical protein